MDETTRRARRNVSESNGGKQAYLKPSIDKRGLIFLDQALLYS